MKPAAVILGIAFAGALGQAHSDGWNQFRGANGSGVAKDGRPPVELDDARLAWKIALPPGLSSPVLSRKLVFLTGLANGRLVTLAIDKADGKIAWQNQTPKVELEKVHKASHPASPSMLVDDDRVFAYFGSYGLLCYNLDGMELWKKPIPTPKSLYGMSTSPIVHGEHLILVLDNDENLPGSRLSQSKIVAFDKTNGEIAWEIPRPFHRSGWSTPMIWEHSEGTELVVLGNGRISGYNMKTGTQKWFIPGFSRETISIPIAGKNILYASSSKLGGGADIRVDPLPFWEAVIRFDKNSDGKIERKEMTGHFTFPIRPELPPGHPGFGIPLPKDKRRRQERLDGMFRGIDRNRDKFWTKEEFIANMRGGRGKPLLIAIRPGGQGDITDTHLKWELNRNIPEIPSPLLYDNLIYMVRNGGLLSTVDATNGKLLYRERLNAPGQYSASPVAANNHVYLASNLGVITVVKADRQFEITHQHNLMDPVFVTPAIDKNTLYIRTEKSLLAFRNN
ncbi:PQQ-binding-like beta-propeller repeat protein [bacterium]|nr:PQQ-binding-like beta-propeller repeat protein [bacterium]